MRTILRRTAPAPLVAAMAVVLALATACTDVPEPTTPPWVAPALVAPAPIGSAAVVCNGLQLDPARSQRALDAVLAAQGLAGAQAAVVLCGREWVGATGWADVAAGRRMALNTPYRGGSTTKLFTTVILMQLIQEGRLGLDDRLARWFPTAPGADAITVRMLLGNRSGYYNYTDDPDFRNQLLAEPDRLWAPDELAAIGVQHPRLFAPGAGFAYSNTNFVIAAMIAERVTGVSYMALLRQRILAPLGLTRTTLPPAEAVPADLAHGYTWAIRDDATIDESYDTPTVRDATFMNNYSHGWSAGALVSTVHDQAVFVRALTRGGLLGPAALVAMAPTDASPAFLGGNYGLGLTRFPTSLGVFAYGHGGQTFGYQTMMLDLPDADLTVVVNANDDHRSLSSLAAVVDAVGASLLAP